MNFTNLRVATKLWLSVVAIIAALLLLIGFAGVRSASLQAEADTTVAALNLRLKLASTWAGLTEANAARTVASAMTFDPSVAERLNADIQKTSAKISVVQKSIEEAQLGPAEKAQMGKVAASRKAMIEVRDKASKFKEDGNYTEAVTVITQEYSPAVEVYLDTLNELVMLEEKSMADFEAYMRNERGLTVKIAGAVVLILIIGILVGAAVLIRSIRLPLAQANELAAHIAQGDLSAHIDVTRGDEFGDLMKSLAAMNESLARMVQQVRQSTDSIATASSEIATGNQDLSIRTEQTSSNLQSTASAMDELTSTVQQSADNARQASALAASASTVAEKGGSVVQQVVSTMEEINTSSKKISDIISVIDGIAFQTNILALNAAVEAARAGEQGRGFAVVASEVRSLAQRSAEAAKEIKGLIGTSVEKVESGTKLVTDAGSTMSDIVQSVRRVADVIGEITAASVEQSSGIADVNQSISNLDQMTQQNAALVEQSAAAAQSMREQADQLAQAVAVFKINAMLRQNPAKDITPKPQKLALASIPAPAPAKKALAAPVSPKSRPAVSAGSDDVSWENF
ncbi:MAG: MCP four helix bundle domain-containing protein [Gammaproteobacteria bacterium]|nr:MCP four helix bundle domain-containing protein [Gammaproteobacteria bacterium]MBU0786127.1 MCP four helix bundle domain-containing protein [Gammaproteobacteria bacterium]MBU0816707.1 MCP four helix bundle domain-containing protein [Gammaproteobacteria bacterium]MBU1786871.1 MCP four helix bundle domain-containing protein [Gammaproteobacteria bacterium]